MKFVRYVAAIVVFLSIEAVAIGFVLISTLETGIASHAYQLAALFTVMLGVLVFIGLSKWYG